MSDFPVEKMRQLTELAYLAEGFEEVKAINIEGDTPMEEDETAVALLADGYRFFDENYYGVGFERLGRIAVFVKGHSSQK